MNTFMYWDEELTYETGEYNDARLNERAIEIPIAQWFMEGEVGTLIEIGNVLSHYRSEDHIIVDKYEQADDVLNVDVFSLIERCDMIIAISTIEHVRWDEPDTGKDWDGSVKALEHLLSLLRVGGQMLVTVPMGWNPYLDTAILDGRIPHPWRQCTLVRDGEGWVQTQGLSHRRYAATTRWAESVWVAEWLR